MKKSKKIKLFLFALVYGLTLFFALNLWLCGRSGNILLGIILIIFYRLSLWFSPIAVTIICWLPLKSNVPVSKRLLFNFAHLLLCGVLSLTCYFLFGNWY